MSCVTHLAHVYFWGSTTSDDGSVSLSLCLSPLPHCLYSSFRLPDASLPPLGGGFSLLQFCQPFPARYMGGKSRRSAHLLPPHSARFPSCRTRVLYRM